jgi:hypothetical protein
VAARYATDTFVIAIGPSNAPHLVQKGSLRDSAHAAVTGNPGAFGTVPLAAGKDVDGKTDGRLKAYPAGTEL